MGRRHKLLALSLLCCPSACDRFELSDAGQYWLDPTPVQRTPTISDRVLIGTEFTVPIIRLAIDGELDEDGGGLLCATQSASGVLEEVGTDRFRVTDLGTGAVVFAAPTESCPANEDVLTTLGPDSWTITGVGSDGLEGRYMPLYDTFLASSDISPGDRGAFPDVLGRPLEDLLVVGDQHFVAVTMLIDPTIDGPAEVRYSEGQALVEVPAHFADVLDTADGNRNRLDGVIGAGESFTPTFSVLGQAFDLGEVSTVSIDQIASLELVPFYGPGDAQREWGVPSGVLAITRDFEGRRVVGAPIEWETSRGDITTEPYDTDLLLIGSTCNEAKAAEHRSAVVEARLGQMVREVEFQWIALPEDENPDDRCTTDCSCSSTRGDSAPAWAAFLLGLGFVARRRSSATRPT